jgi:hypothetical protein
VVVKARSKTVAAKSTPQHVHEAAEHLEALGPPDAHAVMIERLGRDDAKHRAEIIRLSRALKYLQQSFAARSSAESYCEHVLNGLEYQEASELSQDHTSIITVIDRQGIPQITVWGPDDEGESCDDGESE